MFRLMYASCEVFPIDFSPLLMVVFNEERLVNDFSLSNIITIKLDL